MTTTAMLPEAKYVDLDDGNRIHYHDVGEGNPVLFVHGSGPGASGWSNFRDNAEAMAQAGVRCIVPDLLGYGYSTMTETPTFTYDDLAGGVLALADKLGLQTFALVGNSLGGAIAITLALENPDRVDKLILMAPGGLEEKEVYMGMKGIRTMLKAMYSPDGITRDSMRKVFSLQLYNSDMITDQIIEERFQIAEKQPQGMFEKVVVPNQAAALQNLQMPVLGFWGMDDQFCPPSGATILAENCTRAKVTLLTECGHWVMVEHADYFNRACIDFLQH